MGRIERWVIIGDGLSYRITYTPDNDPLTPAEVLKLCHCDHAVINMFDALTGEFLGMAYYNKQLDAIEYVRYGRRQGDIQINAY